MGHFREVFFLREKCYWLCL